MTGMKEWWHRDKMTNGQQLLLGIFLALLGFVASLGLAELGRRDVFEILPTWIWLIAAGGSAVFLLWLIGRWDRERHALERVEEAVGKARTAERQLRENREEASEKYAQHIEDALRLLEQVISLKVEGEVKLYDFIREGLFEPAQGALAESGTRGEVRFSVLRAKDGVFKMTVALGHGLDSKKAYSLPVNGSFAGYALSSGEMEWSNDLETDPRYKPHPKAKTGRNYCSLVCIPLEHADTSNRVLSVLATEKNAFSAPDRIYLRTLARIADVAWATIIAQQRHKQQKAS